LGPRYADAVLYASEVHAGDRRKDVDIPYVSHLLSVSALVLEDGGGEDEAIGALLHDAVEDHGVELLADIRDRFGELVADIVEGCSDSFEPAGVEKQPWEVRKEAYVGHLRTAMLPEPVLLVSCADKLHNARSIVADLRVHGTPTLSRFNAEPDQVLWYYEALTAIFLERLPGHRNPAQLQDTVADLRLLIETGERIPA
jgi:(p)ppGpp synthase/HD superfamily hydrolase